MALPVVGNASYPTPDEIVAQALADVRYAYANAGITVNVAKGSEQYYRMQAVCNRLAIPIANNEIAAESISPLDATGDELEELASTHGVEKRAASAAMGLVTIGLVSNWVGSVTIPAEFICTSAGGMQYETTGSFTVTDGDTVEVQAVVAGSDSNLDEDAIVTWDSAAIGGLEQTATVAAGGIADGAPADTDEVLRTRLLARLRRASTGGNTAHVIDWAENASAAVEAAFCYASSRGPGSYDVAVTSTDSDRIVGASTLNQIASAILGEHPGHVSLIVTSVAEEQLDAIIDLEVPLPVNAGGAGGGWRDAAPWPSDAETGGNVYAEITFVDLVCRQITVNSTAADPPVVGKRFGVWNPAGGDDGLGAMHEFTIQTVGGVPGAYVITIGSGGDSISFITTGMFCSAGAENLGVYATAFRDALRGLGPGEKTANVDILPRSRRIPEPSDSWPQEVTALLLAQVAGSYNEITDFAYAAVIENGTGQAGTGTFTALTAPTVPSTTADPPNILTLANLSFRRRV